MFQGETSFTTEQRQNLMRARSSSPFQISDFASKEEINVLIETFFNDKQKETKATGPICSYYQGLKSIDEKITNLIGPHRRLPMSHIFATRSPHVLHSDGPKEFDAIPLKAILIPLAFQGAATQDSLVTAPYDLSFFTFQQRWYGFPAKFFKGERAIASPHNQPVYEYSEVDQLNAGPPVPESIHRRWLSHLKPEWLEGLSIDQQFDWKPGSAIVFDSFQIHCSSDFRTTGVQMKMGLSIFTAQVP